MKNFNTESQILTDWSTLPRDLEIAIDTETTDLDPFKGEIRLLQTYFPSVNKVAVLDLWNKTQQQEIWLNHFLARYLANKSIKKYMQNGYFDCSWFRVHFGILVENVCDTRLLSQIKKAGQYDAYLFNLKESSPNSLRSLSQEYGANHDKTEQSSDWSKPNLTQSQLDYAAKDPYYTYWIGKEQEEELAENKAVCDAENGSLPAFVEMWYRGLPADWATLKNLSKNYEQAAVDSKLKLSGLMDENPVQKQKILDYKQNPTLGAKGQNIKEPKKNSFNVASPQQVKAYLIQEFGQHSIEKWDSKTRSTKESTGKDVLFSIYSENLDRTDLLDIIAFRGVSKASSTLKSYLGSYDPERGCLQTAYSVLASQGMGRSSSGDRSRKDVQNVQNISKHLSSHKVFGLDPVRSFVKARPGYTLLEIDLSASHAQFARHLSNDESLQEAKNTGLKLHYYTMSAMLGFSGKQVTPQDCVALAKGDYSLIYKLSKTVFYSFLNYAGAATLQQTFFKNDLFVSLEDCKKYLEACANRFAGLRRFQNKMFALADSRRHAVHTKNGRFLGVFGFSETCDGGKIWHQKPQYSDNLKISDVVSSHWLRPEATVMKRSLARVVSLAKSLDLNRVRLVNFSHDSVLIECQNSLIDKVLPASWDIMIQEMQKFVPDYEPDDPIESCILKENWTL